MELRRNKFKQLLSSFGYTEDGEFKKINRKVYIFNSNYQDTVLGLEDKILELQLENGNLNFMNDSKSIQIQMLKNEVEILKKFISHTLNAKNKRIFNFKIDVAPLLLRFIFGLIWLHIFLHKDGFIAHAIIYAFQHYCM